MQRKSKAILVWERNIPLASIFSAAPRKLPASTTTDVVPSPASMSCAIERSTSCGIQSHAVRGIGKRVDRHTILAAGCSAWMLRRMVAPSFVMMTSPCEVWIYMNMKIKVARSQRFDVAHHFVHSLRSERCPHGVADGYFDTQFKARS
jgi:hypothetical protein